MVPVCVAIVDTEVEVEYAEGFRWVADRRWRRGWPSEKEGVESG